jgi:hypothetical protein
VLLSRDFSHRNAYLFLKKKLQRTRERHTFVRYLSATLSIVTLKLSVYSVRTKLVIVDVVIAITIPTFSFSASFFFFFFFFFFFLCRGCASVVVVVLFAFVFLVVGAR